MKILGISAHYHDAAAALVIDGVPFCAVQEERLSRRKNDASFPLASIEWCLSHAGIEPEQLDAVVFYEKPLLKFERILTTALRAFPRSWRSFPRAMKSSLGDKLWVKGIIRSHLGVPGERILFTEHHQAHAACAFLTSPARRAAILTADGVGEWATLSVGKGERHEDGQVSIDTLREVHFPHSLGMLYSTFTAFLGFAVNEGEYKVMGLAAYGKPRLEALVKKLIVRTPDGAFNLDMSYFEYHTTANRSFSSKLVDEFGEPRHPYEPLDLQSAKGQHYADIAASVQKVVEDILVDLATDLRRETGFDDLCLGGGVALNGRANARILRESGFARVLVPPAPGDAGCALGAALLVDRLHFKNHDVPCPDHPFWGPSVDGSELFGIAEEDGLPMTTLDDPGELVARVADELHAGRTVAWMQGATELGPRALGHRSILAAPHHAAMRERLNLEIKYREEFRPFAPAVPLEVADRYFDLPPNGARLARFMSGVFLVKPEHRARLGAVTHVDGTARVQAVDRAMCPLLHDLLWAYGERSGLPVLLNTSLNLAGEPMVNRAVEGYSTFRRSGIDVLVAGTSVVSKRPSSALAPMVHKETG
jgi:carbamoyltransferase